MISAPVTAFAVVPIASASYRAAILCVGPKRRFAAPQRYVSNWEYSGPAWCMLETMQLTCSVLSCSPNQTATVKVAR